MIEIQKFNPNILITQGLFNLSTPFFLIFFSTSLLSIIALQWCVSFCCITKWISHTYTHIPISPPSCVSLPPSLSHYWAGTRWESIHSILISSSTLFSLHYNSDTHFQSLTSINWVHVCLWDMGIFNSQFHSQDLQKFLLPFVSRF